MRTRAPPSLEPRVRGLLALLAFLGPSPLCAVSQGRIASSEEDQQDLSSETPAPSCTLLQAPGSRLQAVGPPQVHLQETLILTELPGMEAGLLAQAVVEAECSGREAMAGAWGSSWSRPPEAASSLILPSSPP